MKGMLATRASYSSLHELFAPHSGHDDNEEKKKRKPTAPHTPIHAKWIVPLIKFVIASKPNMSIENSITVRLIHHFP